MKLFKFKTTVTYQGTYRTPSEFTDWYEGTLEEAWECYREDLHRYGLPEDGLTTLVTEMEVAI